MFVSVFLSVFVSVFLSVFISVFLSVFVSVFLSVIVSVFVFGIRLRIKRLVGWYSSGSSGPNSRLLARGNWASRLPFQGLQRFPYLSAEHQERGGCFNLISTAKRPRNNVREISHSCDVPF